MLRRDLILGVMLVTVLVVIAVASALIALAGASDTLAVAKDSVGIVEITGTIIDPGTAVERIRRLADHDRIKSVVVRLDTPGGGVAATQEIFVALLALHETDKPIVASMGTVAASGGYYIAVACDTIIALPATITGSIGVILEYPVFGGLLDKIGVGYTVVKSGAFKDAGSPFREMTEDERAYLEGLIMDMYDQFVEAVATHRPLSPERVRELGDGRVYTGRQALELGLVDAIGTYQDAIDLAGTLAGLGVDPPVVEDREKSLMERLAGATGKIATESGMGHVPVVSYLMSL